ncbi:hypothetical protein HMPREF2946_07350 [Actinomyces sp. HMSC062G12]|nr:hypothetical protein HMPREF2946_07350 [Actinomyces sp. HMSC062G12]
MFFQLGDELRGNPKIQRLARRAMTGDLSGLAALGMWALAGTACQQALTDGVVSVETLVSDTLNLEVAKTLAGMLVDEGLWHAPGHSCERCVQPPQGSFIFHDWFDLRYDRGEDVRVTRGKRAELKNRKITDAVWLRDRVGGVECGGNMVAPCRYCGTKVQRKDRSTWQYDHVEPTKYIGAANIVIACTDCNKQKQQRTPGEAGMMLHRPGWMPGQADWSAPPHSAEQSTTDTPRCGETVLVEAGEDANPVEGTPSGQVESSSPWNPSSLVSGAADRSKGSPAPARGMVETPEEIQSVVLVEAGEDANPVEGTPSGQVESSSPWNPSNTRASSVDFPPARRPRESARREEGGEDPVEAHASGQVEPASIPRPANPPRPATAPAAAAAAAATATNPAAAAAKRVSTRARACQGREGQGRVLDREGPGRESGGAGQGEPASPRRRRPRRKRQVRDLGASPGTRPMPQHPPGSPGMAGPAPTPQVGGSFGSPWFQWRGRPPVDDEAVCPIHGADVPCRFCLEEESR